MMALGEQRNKNNGVERKGTLYLLNPVKEKGQPERVMLFAVAM